MRNGATTLGIGVLILLAGIGLTAASNGRTLFWGAIAVGAFNILVGLYKMARGT